MKRCPACSRVYDDLSLRFCLDDGTALVNKIDGAIAEPTRVLPAHEPQLTIRHDFVPEVPPIQPVHLPPVAQKRRLLPWLLLGGAVLLFVGQVAAILITKYYGPLSWHLVLQIDPKAPDQENATRQAVNVIERRLNQYGLPNFKVSQQGTDRIQVDLPNVKDPERLKGVITTPGKLELVAVVSPSNPSPVQTYDTEAEASASLHGSIGRRVLRYIEREDSGSTPASKWVVVESPSIVNSAEISDASAEPEGDTNYRGESDRREPNYQIDFTLNQSGADKFAIWTGSNINKYIGVVFNDEVKSIAYIRSQINDKGQITGRFTKAAAEDLALVLKAGALPARFGIVEEKIDK